MLIYPAISFYKNAWIHLLPGFLNKGDAELRDNGRWEPLNYESRTQPSFLQDFRATTRMDFVKSMPRNLKRAEKR